jgi:hypothetical protein
MNLRMNLRKLLHTAAFALVLGTSAFSMTGCDWIFFNFMNSIPFKGNAARNPDVYIYLGVDGLSYHTVQQAMQNGAFAGPEWKLAKFVTMFPGTSDASWTRIMHTPKLGGYEIEYFNPEKDRVVNKGIIGLMKHVSPAIIEPFNFEFDYLKAFDYHGNGYAHGVEAYANTYVSLADSMDNLFYLLEGRVQTATVFSAYMLELDVLGHMQSCGDVSNALKMLAQRIDKFRYKHPERNIHFTILSDHGMDFKKVTSDHFVKMSDELPRVGIKSVETLADHPLEEGPVAIPIMHTRVSYIALHTHPEQAEAVGKAVARLPSVDMTITKLATPPRDPHAQGALEWYGIWTADNRIDAQSDASVSPTQVAPSGKLAVYFGFDPQTNEYYLPSGMDYAKLDVTGLTFDPALDFKIMKDTDVFALTKNSRYPDLFYRTRTSLSSVSVQYPADVMVSFKLGYASLGFTFGKDDIASAGFHGAMDELGSLGTLLTTERELPDAVRADNFLEMFPHMKDHIKSLGVEVIEGDRNASLSR